MRQLKITEKITSRDTVSLDRYLLEVNKLPLINGEKEVELAKLIREGDNKALNTLVSANLRFVISVAKQYQNRGLNLPDLINEGNMGLIKAAQRFDETRGFKFISYAVWWIRQSIIQSISENSKTIRLPLNKVSMMQKMYNFQSFFEQEYQRQPTIDEIAQHIGTSKEQILQCHEHSKKHISMDAPVKEDSESTRYNLIENLSSPKPDANLLHESMCSDINTALSGLSEREADVLKLYFGLNGDEAMSLLEIGHTFSISRERVRQLKDLAIKKLRLKSSIQVLANYLNVTR
ncbi:sigma-70 family RNA polymerase sigma factor [Winogradskyella aurantiaca]|uniref:sigma-70 family RNA polymerase sigma factor n=1 Tax=Winogradskyella aurantiaca TaxID=2219558 RepID=UPI000E1D73B4|nr:RNA polymerase sigma factor RpoD/SigA [Winogradskyella aurantiaca]